MTQTFESLIASNKNKSILLVLGLILLTLGLCGIAGWILVGLPFVNFGIRAGIYFGAFASIIGAVVSYFAGSKMILAATGARKLQHTDDPVLFNVVEEMSIAAAIPVPDIYLMEDSSLNAFATGRDPKHALVCITSGLREKLNRDELQAVIAHELSHIRNYDILLMMLVGVFAGMTVLVSDFLVNSNSRDMDGNSKIPSIVVAILSSFVALIAPLIANLLKLCVSREREYLADASAVQLCRNPLALASALRKLTENPEPSATANRATEHLFIVSPNHKVNLSSGSWDSIWSTHPPIDKRIARIEALA